MAETSNGPKLWDAVLEVIGHRKAVIAGGCIRDWCLNIAPKDIDIFVPCGNMDEWLEFKYNLVSEQSDLFDLLDIQEGKEYERTDFSKERNPLYGVLAGQILGCEVNIIARTSHTSNQELIDLFDFDILQAWYSPHPDSTGRKFFWNDHHKVALMTRTATITHDKHLEQSVARFMRFNRRHPGLLSLNIPWDYDPCQTTK